MPEEKVIIYEESPGVQLLSFSTIKLKQYYYLHLKDKKTKELKEIKVSAQGPGQWGQSLVYTYMLNTYVCLLI